MAMNKTASELTNELTELYSKEFKEPRVSVIVKSFTDQRIYVAGEVNQPALIDLVGNTTVLQAVAQAGGLKYTAKRNEIVVLRRRSDGRPEVYQIDIDKAISGTDLAQNMALRPLDVVYIPRTSISNIDQWIDEHFYKLIPLSFTADYDLNP